MSDASRRVYEFGPFRIDTGDRLLSRDGQLIPLPPKAVETLLALIGGALGLAILCLIAMGDKSMHTERDVELALKLPVLALVPVLEALSQGKSESPKNQRAWA